MYPWFAPPAALPEGPLVSVRRVARPGIGTRDSSMPVTLVRKATSCGWSSGRPLFDRRARRLVPTLAS